MQKLWYSASPQLAEKRCKSLLHPFSIKGFEGLAINPYQGCQHRCAYCYATYEWSPEFYDLIYAKSNAPAILDGQLSTWRTSEIGPVMVGSATDSYQPAEIRYGLTRKCVEVLQKHNVPYYVFTKSAIITRDLELHANYSDACAIVWSLTTCNERVRRIVEPGTPPSERIFKAIRRFSKRGVVCGVNVDPIIPLVTDSLAEFDSLASQAKAAGVRHMFGSVLRLRHDIWERMKVALGLLQVPHFEKQYEEIYKISSAELDKSPRGYWAASDAYQNSILDRMSSRIKAAGISDHFPTNLAPRTLRRAPVGQSTMIQYIASPCCSTATCMAQ